MNIANKKNIFIGIMLFGLLLFLGIKNNFIKLNFFTNYLRLAKTDYQNLPGWGTDNHQQALATFKNSCQEILRLNPYLNFSSLPYSGKNSDWQNVCVAASQLTNPNEKEAKQFFEYWFQPFAVKNFFNPYGLFTGYYLPLLQASEKKSAHFSVPIYALPTDLAKIDLGLFHPEWRGRILVGQVKNNNLYPYPSRADINKGSIAKNTPVLFWSNNLIDVFFLQIQGSGIMQLQNGKKILIGYAGNNGQPYSSIGKFLVKYKDLDSEQISLQSIRTWLNQHPDQINTLLDQNPSYVFFKKLPNQVPLGTEQVPLTPQRSLAIDSTYLPLGIPLWLDTTLDSEKNKILFQHLLIAQDTGSGTKGVVSGDIYWGSGMDAENIAGHLKSRGRYWVLLPRPQLLNHP